jgi:hypothetical protein
MSFKKERFEARLLSIVHNFNMFVISLVCMVGIFYGVFDLMKVRGGKLVSKLAVDLGALLRLFFFVLFGPSRISTAGPSALAVHI